MAIGERQLVRSEASWLLCIFDQVLGLAPGAVDHIVEVLGRATVEIGDDEADIEAHRGCLDAGADATLKLPGLRLVVGLGIAAQHRLALERAARVDVVGALVDEPPENRVAGRPKM